MPFLMGVHSSMMEVSEGGREEGCVRVWGSHVCVQLVCKWVLVATACGLEL